MTTNKNLNFHISLGVWRVKLWQNNICYYLPKLCVKPWSVQKYIPIPGTHLDSDWTKTNNKQNIWILYKLYYIWEFVTRDTEKCPLCVFAGVRIKQVNFRENIWAFCWDKRNCPYKAGVCIKRVSLERGSTVIVEHLVCVIFMACILWDAKTDWSIWRCFNCRTSCLCDFCGCSCGRCLTRHISFSLCCALR